MRIRSDRLAQALLAVELAVAASLDQAVGVQNHRVSGLEPRARLLVALPGLDPQREPPRREWLRRALSPDEQRRRMPCRGAGELSVARVDQEVEERDELPRRD